MDQLENLHIGGAEGVPQGGNDHNDTQQGSGPGFGVEGSVELDHQLRTRDQEFGESTTKGPAKPVED
ncbi:hypothetical protein [Hymenobacter sp. AT01-02]|nr:hypothetical protein [Hymenobacter sp. AT01-02]